MKVKELIQKLHALDPESDAKEPSLSNTALYALGVCLEKIQQFNVDLGACEKSVINILPKGSLSAIRIVATTIDVSGETITLKQADGKKFGSFEIKYLAAWWLEAHSLPIVHHLDAKATFSK